MLQQYDKIDDSKNLRTVMIGAAVVVWAWNIADALLFGSGTEEGKTEAVRSSILFAHRQDQVQLRWSVDF